MKIILKSIGKHPPKYFGILAFRYYAPIIPVDVE